MKRRMAKIAGALLVVAGLAVALYPQLTELRYGFEQRAFAAQVGSRTETATPGGEPIPDGAVAHLVIPRIGVDAYVVEGTELEQLDRGPGHYPGTPLPGDPGNCGIAGHRTMHGHVFRRLDELQPGDEIVTATAKGRAVYRVVAVRVVNKSDWSVVDPFDGYRLTLTSCHPVGSARQRLCVTAEMTR